MDVVEHTCNNGRESDVTDCDANESFSQTLQRRVPAPESLFLDSVNSKASPSGLSSMSAVSRLVADDDLRLEQLRAENSLPTPPLPRGSEED